MQKWKRKIAAKRFKQELFFKTKLPIGFPCSDPDLYAERPVYDWKGLVWNEAGVTNQAEPKVTISCLKTKEIDTSNPFELYLHVMNSGHEVKVELLHKLLNDIADSTVLSTKAKENRFNNVLSYIKDKTNKDFNSYLKVFKSQIDSLETAQKLCEAFRVTKLDQECADLIVEGLVANSRFKEAEKFVTEQGISNKSLYLLTMANNNLPFNATLNVNKLGSWLTHELIKFVIISVEDHKMSKKDASLFIENIFEQFKDGKAVVPLRLQQRIDHFFQINALEDFGETRLNYLVTIAEKDPILRNFEAVREYFLALLSSSYQFTEYQVLNSIVRLACKIALTNVKTKSIISRAAAFAHLVHRRLREWNLYCEDSTYLALMDLFSRTKNVPRVMSCFRQIQRRDRKVLSDHYYYLIKVHCNRGSVLKATIAVQEMIDRRVSPSTEIFNLLVTAYLKQKIPNFSKALNLLGLFPSVQIVANNATHSAFGEALIQNGTEFDMNTWILTLQMISSTPNPIIFKTILQFYRYQTMKFQFYTDVTISRGFVSTEIFEIILDHYSQFRIAEIEDIWNRVDKSIRSQNCYKIMLEVAFSKRDWSQYSIILDDYISTASHHSDWQAIFDQLLVLNPIKCKILFLDHILPTKYPICKISIDSFLLLFHDDVELISRVGTYQSMNGKIPEMIDYPKLEYDLSKLHETHVSKKLLKSHYRRIIRRILQTP